MNVLVRLVAVPIAVTAVLSAAVFSGAGSATADPPPTQVVTTVAVGSGGQAINGYQEAPPQGNVPTVTLAVNIHTSAPGAPIAAESGRT